MGLKNKQGRKAVGIDGRRCSKCKKLAKDIIDGQYLCRIHSSLREGYIGDKI